MANKKKNPAKALVKIEKKVINEVKKAKPKAPPHKKGGFSGKTISDLIDGAADMVSSMFVGRGKYDISKNSLMNNLKNTNRPEFTTVSEGLRITHREYIGDVVSSSNTNFFNNSVYSVNPGLSATFPWLATVAQQFQEYEWMGLIFEYQTTSADALNSTNTALGTVIAVANYRVDVPYGNLPFLGKQQMLDQFWAYDEKPSKSFIIPIECDPKENPMNVQYIRGGPVPTGEDPKTYDICALNIATMGLQGSNVNCGELWVSYDVILKKPQPIGMTAAYSNSAQYYFPSVTNAAPCSGVATPVYDNIGLVFGVDTIKFPAGSIGAYVLTFTWFGSSAAAVVTPTFAYSGGLGPYLYFQLYGGTASQLTVPYSTTSSAALSVQLAVLITTSNATTLTLGTAVLPNSSYLNLTVNQTPLNAYA